MLSMWARRNDDGVSVNETALCGDCIHDLEAVSHSLHALKSADDFNGGDTALFPIDNPDGRCIGCGRISNSETN